ncbi:alanine racemase [Alphaproteobacteria bacterium]|nr:alanine racemase [Alphaproteobacteria bacterium]
MKINNLDDLNTPCLILDKNVLEKNCNKAREKCRKLNTTLRPHVKTPKSIEVAKIALGKETGPITVSTIREAEYFADAGFKDILYAVCIIPKKLERLHFIQKKYNCTIRMVIDSVFVAKEILKFAKTSNANFEVLIEIDCGEGRGGINFQDENIREISKIFDECGYSKLIGVMSHAGHSYSTNDKNEIVSISNKERDDALASINNFTNINRTPPVVSIGSTPTMFCASHLNGVSEIRAGIYMFWDLAQASKGICEIKDIAVTVLTSVIGHNYQNKKIIVDAGALALSKDISANKFMQEVGYGLVCNPNTGLPLSDLAISEVHQEHGAINISDTSWFDKLPIGSLLRVLPNHACLTCAAYENYNVLENETINDRWDRINGW